MNKQPMYYLMKGVGIYEGHLIITTRSDNIYTIKDVLMKDNFSSWVGTKFHASIIMFKIAYRSGDYDKVMGRGLLEVL